MLAAPDPVVAVGARAAGVVVAGVVVEVLVGVVEVLVGVVEVLVGVVEVLVGVVEVLVGVVEVLAGVVEVVDVVVVPAGGGGTATPGGRPVGTPGTATGVTGPAGMPVGDRGCSGCFCSHVANRPGLRTNVVDRMKAWPAPQSSVHSTVQPPRLVGVTRSVVVMPGTASIFWENSGTKKLWMTSSERILKTIGRPFGR
jgi:hypothetical protein